MPIGTFHREWADQRGCALEDKGCLIYLLSKFPVFGTTPPPLIEVHLPPPPLCGIVRAALNLLTDSYLGIRQATLNPHLNQIPTIVFDTVKCAKVTLLDV